MSAFRHLEYHEMTDQQRDAIHDWLHRHGIDPTQVPANGPVDRDGDQWIIPIFLHNENGAFYLGPDGEIARDTVRVTSDEAIPWPTTTLAAGYGISEEEQP